MSLWKTWSDVWDKIVVEEGLTSTCPRWTMHWRRASRGLDVEEPYVIEKGKWMFNLRNQAYYEESYITKCQSLLNQEVKWLGYQKWKLIIRCDVLQVTTSKESMLKQNQSGTSHEVKKKWSGKIQYWCKPKLKELVLYLILSIVYRSIKRDTRCIANKVSKLT
jgi:hypothetical protein